jgi:hypothetical protein
MPHAATEVTASDVAIEEIVLGYGRLETERRNRACRPAFLPAARYR